LGFDGLASLSLLILCNRELKASPPAFARLVDEGWPLAAL
jgi:hypothetical protein